MAETHRTKFERGDFLRKDNKKGSFMIYEGNNISETSYKKMTLVCWFDPEKFVRNEFGAYTEQPSLEVGSLNKPCTTTIDTEEEDYWVKICSPQEKAEALEVLEAYGYHWNEDTFELVDNGTGEVIRKLIIPDNSYHGEVVSPIKKTFKDMIKKYCISKIKPTYQYSNYDYYDCYD